MFFKKKPPIEEHKTILNRIVNEQEQAILNLKTRLNAVELDIALINNRLKNRVFQGKREEEKEEDKNESFKFLNPFKL